MKPAIITIGRSIERKHFSDNPIIIGACPRSGTTLLLSILDAHPHIHGIQNQTYAFTQWINRTTNGNSAYQPGRLDRLYREFLFRKIGEKATRYCEKTPKNVQYFREILQYFGERAKIIHMIRDGRDVVTSKHPKHTPNEYWVSVQRWIRDVQSGLEFSQYPNVYTIFYEKMLSDFKSEIRKLLRFLQEEYVAEIDNWSRNTTVKKSKHWAESVQHLHTNAVGKWKKPEHRVQYNEFMQNQDAVNLMKSLGYSM